MSEVLGRAVGDRGFLYLVAYDTSEDRITAQRCESIIVKTESGSEQVVVATPSSLACSGGRWDPKAAARVGRTAKGFHRVPTNSIISAVGPSWSANVVFFDQQPSISDLQGELNDQPGDTVNEDVAAAMAESSGRSSSFFSSWDRVSQLAATLEAAPTGASRAEKGTFDTVADEDEDAEEAKDDELGDGQMKMYVCSHANGRGPNELKDHFNHAITAHRKNRPYRRSRLTRASGDSERERRHEPHPGVDARLGRQADREVGAPERGGSLRRLLDLGRAPLHQSSIAGPRRKGVTAAGPAFSGSRVRGAPVPRTWCRGRPT